MSHKKLIILSTVLIVFCFLFLTQAALAEPPRLQLPNPRIQLPSFEGFSAVDAIFDPETRSYYYEIPWIGEYLASIYKYGVALASVLAFIMIMVGGLMYIMAGGAPDKITLAKNIIGGAVAGLILALGSYLILYTVNPALVTFQALKIKWIAPIFRDVDNHCRLPGEEVTDISMLADSKEASCCNKCKTTEPDYFQSYDEYAVVTIEMGSCSTNPEECKGGGIQDINWEKAGPELSTLLEEIKWQISGHVYRIDYCSVDLITESFLATERLLLSKKIDHLVENFYCESNGKNVDCKDTEKQIAYIHIETAGCVGGLCTGEPCKDDDINICGTKSTTCHERAEGWDDLWVDKVLRRSDIVAGSLCENLKTGEKVEIVPFVKAIMSQESRGIPGTPSYNGTAFGLMQMKPETARRFSNGCTEEYIDEDWLLSADRDHHPERVTATVCIAVNYMKYLSDSSICSCGVREVAAGYNGGEGAEGACYVSRDCEGCSVCPGQTRPTMRWECWWNDKKHKTCNADLCTPLQLEKEWPCGYHQTRKYAPEVAYCYGEFE